jgi:hypothetical protein
MARTMDGFRVRVEFDRSTEEYTVTAYTRRGWSVVKRTTDNSEAHRYARELVELSRA